jgi:GNAT superfamily N-acetyltransferase
VQIDYDSRLVLVGLLGEPGEERIIAVGRYVLDEQTRLAELAFVVEEEYQGRGIGIHLVRRLVEIVREKGFAGVTAQVLRANAPMLHIFQKLLPEMEQRADGTEVHLRYRFAAAGQ